MGEFRDGLGSPVDSHVEIPWGKWEGGNGEIAYSYQRISYVPFVMSPLSLLVPFVPPRLPKTIGPLHGQPANNEHGEPKEHSAYTQDEAVLAVCH